MNSPMKAGRELDDIMATDVMGWELIPCTGNGPAVYHDYKNNKDTLVENWHPSTDISDAWEVVEKLSPTHHFQLKNHSHHCNWEVIFWLFNQEHLKATGDTASHAICLGALKTCSIDE